MEREQDRRAVGGQGVQLGQDRAQCDGVVGVLGAVDGGQHVPVRDDAVRAEQRGAVLGVRQVAAHDLDDGVAGQRDPSGVGALGQEVGAVAGGGGAQDVGELVDQDAVVLLGHVPVPAAQPGLDVQQRQPARVGGQRAGQRRVGVALHHHGQRRPAGEQLVELREGGGDLRGTGLPADACQAGRLGDPQLAQELAGQFPVVVLPGVHDVCGRAEQADEIGELDQFRAGAQDDGDGVRGKGVQQRSSAGSGMRTRASGCAAPSRGREWPAATVREPGCPDGRRPVAARLLLRRKPRSGPWARAFGPGARWEVADAPAPLYGTR